MSRRALADGAIGGLDDPITRYVPELKGSDFQDNTIRQLLRMSSGVKWVEDYNPTATTTSLDRSSIRQTG